jgi:hypothetical protein
MPKTRASVSYSIPAPTGGWNARDPLDNMPENDAIKLINMFPDTLSVKVRKGFRYHSSGMGGQVQSGIEYSKADGTKQLIVFANNKVWNASTFLGTATDITGAATITTSKWQVVNVRSSATNYLIMVNGSDQPLKWDGTTLSSTAFTGVTDDNLIDINYYKTIPYLVEKNTASFWYGGVDAISGALTQFDLGSIFTLGGSLLWTRTWSKESSGSLEDIFVACSANGEVLIYSGLNAGDASWTLIGRHYIPRPIGIRSVVNLAGEPHILTIQGIIPLSQLLHRTDTQAFVTDKIRQAITAAASTYKSNFGWQMVPYYQGYSLYVNIPVAEGVTSEQYVMNFLNGSWTRYTGMNASSIFTYNDKLYFGGMDGFVYEADVTNSDLGGAIDWEMKQSFNYFQDRANLKRFVYVKPIITTNNSLTFSTGVDVDFSDITLTDSSISVGTAGTPWGSAWGSPWSSESDMVVQNWYNILGIGRAAAFKLKGSSQEISFALQTTNILYEPGGVL